MRKVLFAIIFIAVLSACGKKNVSDVNYQDDVVVPLPPAESEVQEGDFIYRLYSEKDVYDTFGGTAIFAELTYVGPLDEITISHAASPFYFPLEERTRGMNIDYAMNEPLIWRVLKKGEPFRQTYSFAGGYGDQDDPEYIKFVQSIMENKGFPKGEYIIHGSAQFYLGDPAEDAEEMVLSTSIGFHVTDPIK